METNWMDDRNEFATDPHTHTYKQCMGWPSRQLVSGALNCQMHASCIQSALSTHPTGICSVSPTITKIDRTRTPMPSFDTRIHPRQTALLRSDLIVAPRLELKPGVDSPNIDIGDRTLLLPGGYGRKAPLLSG